MTDTDQIVALLKVIANRLSRIERAICGPSPRYRVAEDGVLTRIAEDAHSFPCDDRHRS